MASTFLITGASSGLGLALAHRLSTLPGLHLILPVRHAERATWLRSALPQAQISTPVLDLSRLESVRRFEMPDAQTLDAVLLNAGVQSANTIVRTVDGMEQSFAVNHLAHHLLLRKLTPRLSPQAIVGWTASGTHNPHDRVARNFGFAGAHYLPPQALAQGRYTSAPNAQQMNRDAYASSKGLNVLSARHFARQETGQRRYFAYDPGLMAGTGLAREHGAMLNMAWKYVLPLVSKAFKGASTPIGSAYLLARILSGEHKLPNGAYVDYTGTQLAPHVPADEDAYAQALTTFSDNYQ